jgi:hypothetical protein
MNHTELGAGTSAHDRDTSLASREVVEWELLLPASQAAALEAAAGQRGLTVGEVLRALVRHFLSEPGELLMKAAEEPGQTADQLPRRAR